MKKQGDHNTHHFKMGLAMLVIIFLLSACNLSSNAGESPQVQKTNTPTQSFSAMDLPADQTIAETPQSEVEPTPEPTVQTVSVLRLDGTTEEVPYAITGYKDLLEEKIFNGEWTEGEGLIQLLRLFTNEISLAEVPEAQLVVSRESTEITRWSRDFIADVNNDATQIEEMKRQLAKLFPDQDTLDLISQPAMAAAMQGSAKNAILNQQATATACQVLAVNGFDQAYFDGNHCYVYDEAQVNGHQYRIYYPTEWQIEEDKKLIIDAALVGMTDSVSTFSNLGDFKDVNLLISLLPEPNHPHYEAVQDYTPKEGTCPVTLFPISDDSGLDYFKQVIAHELFHCFQDWNYTTEPYKQNAWWMEGSANYFSNVVYPETNAEWGFAAQFDTDSLTKTLQEMSYENFIFFQYAANRYGDMAIIDLLRMLGESSGSASTLANYQAMAITFQDFVVSYMSEGIRDTSGVLKGARNPSVIRKVRFDKEGEETFSVRAFLPARYKTDYEKEERFLQEPKPTGNGQYSTAKDDLRHDPASWSGLPPEIRSTCKDDVRYALVVTTTDTNANYEFKIIVNEVEKAECDPCLLGVWEIDNDSFEEFILGVMRSSGENLPADFAQEINGHYYTEFNEEGEMLTRRDGFSITFGLEENMVMTTIIDSQGNGYYSADGELIKFTQVTDYVNQVEARLNNVPLSINQTPGAGSATFLGQSSALPGYENDIESQASSGSYVCTEETLTLDQANYGVLLFNRVEKMIPTPVPTLSP